MNQESQAMRILSGDDALLKLDEGVRIAAETIGMTMGAKGKNVAIRLTGIGAGKVILTKDGVTVANSLGHPDPEIRMGMDLAVEASRKTNDAAGDGTTCTVVLLYSMLQEARKRIKNGSNPIRMQQGMQLEKDRVLAFLNEIQKPVEEQEELYNVALVSCQDKEIARKISDIIQDVGKYGTVGVEAHTGAYSINLRVQKGMYLDAGYNPMLTSLTTASIAGQLQRKVSTSNLSWENDEVGVLLFDEPVKAWDDVAHIFDACVGQGFKKFLIFGDFADDASIGLLAQYRAGNFTACLINRGIFGGETGREILKDIAVYTGARFLSPAEGTMPPKDKEITNIPAILGSCSATVTRDSFSLTKGNGTSLDVEARILMIEDMLKNGGLNAYDTQKYKERIARFKAGIGTITIFAPTEVQQQSIRTRVDDAVCAVRSANEEGIVAGGGVALLRCHQWLKANPVEGEDKDTREGREIVRDALLQPARTISEVSGEEPGMRLLQLQAYKSDSTMGYDYWADEECDLMERGIIDPKKVVRLCVENAVSVVGEHLRVGASIVPLPEDERPEPFLTPRQRAEQAHMQRAGQAR